MSVLPPSAILRIPGRSQSKHTPSKSIKKRGTFSSPLTSQILFASSVEHSNFNNRLLQQQTTPVVKTIKDVHHPPKKNQIQSSSYGKISNVTSPGQRRYSELQGWVVPTTDQRKDTYKKSIAPSYHKVAPRFSDAAEEHVVGN